MLDYESLCGAKMMMTWNETHANAPMWCVVFIEYRVRKNGKQFERMRCGAACEMLYHIYIYV